MQGRSGAAAASSELSPAARYDAAREVALKSLTVCARTRFQLAATLERKGFDPDTVTAVLDRLTEVGLIDDVAYAATLVRTRVAERALARPAIAAELARKGIADEVAQAALAHVDEDKEAAGALRLAQAKARATSGLPREVRHRRMLAQLARKGYEPEVARAAVRQALGAEEAVASFPVQEAGDEEAAAPFVAEGVGNDE